MKPRVIKIGFLRRGCALGVRVDDVPRTEPAGGGVVVVRSARGLTHMGDAVRDGLHRRKRRSKQRQQKAGHEGSPEISHLANVAAGPGPGKRGRVGAPAGVHGERRSDHNYCRNGSIGGVLKGNTSALSDFRRVDRPFDSGTSKWVYGQTSQEIVSWNTSFATELKEPSFAARELCTDIASRDGARALARELLMMKPDEYADAFKGSAIKRATLWMLKRNACVLLGNIGTAEDLPTLQAISSGEPAVVRNRRRGRSHDSERSDLRSRRIGSRSRCMRRTAPMTCFICQLRA